MSRATVTVELPGLPALIVTGECWGPEPEVGITWWMVDALDWHAAEGELTPEQDCEVYEHTRELEDAVLAAFHGQREAAFSEGGAL